jgi:hypothetical protein
MKLFLSSILFLFISKVFAQSFPETDIDFVINKVKNVYVGFSDKVRGNEFEKLIREVKASNSKDTFANLSKLTIFFNDPHLRLFQTIHAQNIDTVQCKRNLKSINKLIKKNKRSKLSGYWLNTKNDVVIYLNEKNKNSFEGFVVESKYSNIPNGFCNIKMERNGQNELVTDYTNLNVKRIRRFFLKFNFKNDSVLMGNAYSKWRKINNYHTGYLKDKQAFDYTASFTVIDSNTVVLKLPSFNSNQIAINDSLIKANITKMAKSKTLIIDIRNNDGGLVTNLNLLFPLICTDSIKGRRTVRFIDTNYIREMEFIKMRIDSTKDSVRIKRFAPQLDSLRFKIGSSVVWDKSTVYACKDTMLNKVKNVAIITNYACLSASEMMVLYFKQSKKVKVFGETTGGALDYLNNKTFYSPQSNYLMSVATVKMEISEENPSYDNIGIKPNIEIRDDEPDWVDFVKKYYEK